LLGYYYTANKLSDCVLLTLMFALVAETLRAMLKRLILVRRRFVHIREGRRRREARIQEQMEARRQAEESGETADTEAVDEPLVDPELLEDIRPDEDIDDNARQANQLISLLMIWVWVVGMWFIWLDVLPAFRALENYTLYTVDEVVAAEPTSTEAAPTITNNVVPANEGATSTATEANGKSKPERVTLSDLLAFVIILIVTYIAARHLPAALEMLFLEQMPVDRSVRFAIKSLTRYAIVLVGIILAFNTLAIRWDQVQWLATAMTFGLAFGLQEIFANFVAGIIMMFERPVRIGDWVTVDQYTGVVTNIRTRATTIRDWDRKEYLIPNKDFITGRVVNWTLSDSMSRIVLNVGIAYGSDVERAASVLLNVCEEHPLTLDEPPTRVGLEGFGDHALNMVVRTFVGDVGSRLAVVDDLHKRINKAFHEAGIQIPFPQQDLHVRSITEDAARKLRGTEEEYS
ncbi:MAG: mechanosensitive ion channel domain-containing protein, partial [Pirellulaceae bacterium]